MNQRIEISQTGSPDVMQLVSLDLPEPAPDEVRLRHEAIGVNYVDIYHRSGVYPVPLPSGLGMEATGRIEAVGSAVQGYAVGDRVAYGSAGPGSYATARNVKADLLVPVPVPDGMEAADIVSFLFKGLTAYMLMTKMKRPTSDEPVLVQAAAGGVGLVLTKWLTSLGISVIGVVSNEEKARLVKEMGAHGVIVAANEGDMAGLPAKVRAIAPRGVPIVYDGTGASTFRASLASLAPFGLLISFGNAGGVVPPVDIGELGRMGSLGIQRPSLFTMMADARERKEASQAVFQAFKENRIPAHIHAKLPLHEAAEAHRILESRKSMGSIVLIP